MALVATRPWSTAFGSQAAINWGHPLAQRLAFYCLMSPLSTWNLATTGHVSPDVASSTQPVKTFGAYGRVISIAATSDNNRYLGFSASKFDNVALAINGDITAAVMARANNATPGGNNYGHIWHRNNDGGTGSGRWFFIAASAGSGIPHQVYFSYRNSTNAASYSAVSLSAMSQTVYDVYVATRVAGTLSIYRNGIFQASAAASVDGGANAYEMRWGHVNHVTQSGGAVSIGLSAWWTRGLTPSEVASFSANPYQLLSPVRRVLVPGPGLTAAAGAYT